MHLYGTWLYGSPRYQAGTPTNRHNVKIDKCRINVVCTLFPIDVTLTLPQSQGGLGAPDFSLYAFCAQVQFLHFWIHPIPFQPHVAVECDIAAPTTLEVALYRPYKCPRHTIDTTETLTWAWDNLRRRANTPTLYAPSIDLAKNPQTPPLEDQGAIARARRLGISGFADLYREEGFLGPPAPTDTPPPSFSNTLLYHRIRAFCRQMHNTFPDPPPTLQALENILTTSSAQKLITRLYTSKQTPSSDNSET